MGHHHTSYMREYGQRFPGYRLGSNLRRYWPQLHWRDALDEYNRLLRIQDYCCAICGVHEILLPRKLAVDHCHTTGKIRGLLCSSCNSRVLVTCELYPHLIPVATERSALRYRAPNKGVPMTEAQREHMREIKTGTKHTSQTRKRMATAQQTRRVREKPTKGPVK